MTKEIKMERKYIRFIFRAESIKKMIFDRHIFNNRETSIIPGNMLLRNYAFLCIFGNYVTTSSLHNMSVNDNRVYSITYQTMRVPMYDKTRGMIINEFNNEHIIELYIFLRLLT